MKQIIRFTVAAVCLSFMSIATAVAQDQYTEGGSRGSLWSKYCPDISMRSWTT